MNKVLVNDRFGFEITSSAEGLNLNGRLVGFDICANGGRLFHVIVNNQSYSAELVDLNEAQKTCIIKINGNSYEVSVKNQYDQLLEKLGLNNSNITVVTELKAPMPGLVLQVYVREGETIIKGDNLFILEAMKMENIVKAPADLTIKSVLIRPGEQVEKGQVLIHFKQAD